MVKKRKRGTGFEDTRGTQRGSKRSLMEELSDVEEQFDKDFAIAMQVAERAPRVHQMIAFEENLIFHKPLRKRWTNSQINEMKDILPQEILGLIADFKESSYETKARERVLDELRRVTCVLRYGFCPFYKKIFCRVKKDGRIHWDYLDKKRDKIVIRHDEDLDDSDDGDEMFLNFIFPEE